MERDIGSKIKWSGYSWKDIEAGSAVVCMWDVVDGLAFPYRRGPKQISTMYLSWSASTQAYKLENASVSQLGQSDQSRWTNETHLLSLALFSSSIRFLHRAKSDHLHLSALLEGYQENSSHCFGDILRYVPWESDCRLMYNVQTWATTTGDAVHQTGCFTAECLLDGDGSFGDLQGCVTWLQAE